ncbi:hypothetical protein ACWIHQ_40750, partial [Streptomyces anulatus]
IRRAPALLASFRPDRINFALERLGFVAVAVNAFPKSVDLELYRITDGSMSLLAASQVTQRLRHGYCHRDDGDGPEADHGRYEHVHGQPRAGLRVVSGEPAQGLKLRQQQSCNNRGP